MSHYILNLITLISINAVLAVTLNFIMGYAGIFSMAHALFYGVGAYLAAFIAFNFSTSLFVVLPIVIFVTGIISLILALPALRVRGEYFVAASLGLQILGTTTFSEWKSFTGGIGGVIGIPPVSVFGYEIYNAFSFALLSVTYLVVIVFFVNKLLKSSFGRQLQSIRDSESAAQAFGKNVAVLKTLAVMLAASLAATAGVIYAFYMSFINVESFTLDTSVLIMAMVIIGGTGTLIGPIVGATLLILLPSVFSYIPFLPQTEIGSIQQIAYGLTMVLLMIFRPGGIVGRSKKGAKDEK